MNIAKLHVIYSLLLAHCLNLDAATEKAARRKFGNVYGEMFERPVNQNDLCETRIDMLREFICRDPRVSKGAVVPALGGPSVNPVGDAGSIPAAGSSAGQTKVSANVDPPSAAVAQWQCLKHRWPACWLCVIDAFLPMIDEQEFSLYEAEQMRAIASRFPPAPVKICNVPSVAGMLIAANWLAQHFDLTEVPGFYFEKARPALPGNEDEIDWLRERLSDERGCWQINFAPKLMRSGVGVLAPYDNGTGCIVGLRVYRSVRDRNPFLLSSRDKPGGAPAVAFKENAA